MLYLDDILYEIEESEIWSFNYNIMEGTIYLSIVNPYTAVRHEMTIEKIYNIPDENLRNKLMEKVEKDFEGSMELIELISGKVS